MKFTVNTDELLEELNEIQPEDRVKKSLYFSEAAYQAFAKETGVISPSRMIEWFMIKYVKTKNKRKKS